ncbi:MAG: signal peptidase I [Deltaproteobacteria bacterium]|nr:signal peptidase I [Deltaproteobacteria bacterium]
MRRSWFIKPRNSRAGKSDLTVENRSRSPAARILLHFWHGWIRPVLPVLIVLFTFRGAVADWMQVPSGSMRPTIMEGDRIWVNKLAFGLRVPFTSYWLSQWDGPARGEIVVFRSPKSGDVLVKRCVGLPGDTIEMRSNHLIINGEPVEIEDAPTAFSERMPNGMTVEQRVYPETLGAHQHPMTVTPRLAAERDFGPVAVPAGKYWMMGDNRDRSADSRYFGFVPRDSLMGRSSRVFWSLDPDNWYLPRFSRWLRALP